MQLPHLLLTATKLLEVQMQGFDLRVWLHLKATELHALPLLSAAPLCRVTGLPPRQRVVALAAANKHSAAVMCTGDVYTWGANASGQ